MSLEIYKDPEEIEKFYQDTLREFENTSYKKYFFGVISTDQHDSHNEVIPLDGLKSLERAINTKGIPVNVEHDLRSHHAGKHLERTSSAL